MSSSYEISPIGFGWLGQAFTDKNIISPFSLYEKYASGFNEKIKEELISQGVIGQDGTIQPPGLAAFNVLAKADGYSRIRILGTTAPVDKVTYFQGAAACSVDSGAENFTVTFPAMSKEAGFVFEEFTGSSRFVNVPFHTKLSPKAALAFLDLVDLYRSRALLALAGEPKPANFGLNDILNKSDSSGTLMSFVKSLKSLVNAVSLSGDEGLAAIAELKENKLVEEQNGKYYLINEAFELAGTFLIPEYVFNISYGRVISSTEVEQSECNVIYCGMHNLLYIDTEKDMISLETMSGSELLSILTHSLTEFPA